LFCEGLDQHPNEDTAHGRDHHGKHTAKDHDPPAEENLQDLFLVLAHRSGIRLLSSELALWCACCAAIRSYRHLRRRLEAR
jgi:hypothetical protein